MKDIKLPVTETQCEHAVQNSGSILEFLILACIRIEVVLKANVVVSPESCFIGTDGKDAQVLPGNIQAWDCPRFEAVGVVASNDGVCQFFPCVIYT